MYRMFLNFAKNCVLSCLSKFDIKKKLSMPFLKYKRLKLKLTVFLAGQCCYGNVLCHENDTNVFTSDCLVFFDTRIVAESIDKGW